VLGGSILSLAKTRCECWKHKNNCNSISKIHQNQRLLEFIPCLVFFSMFQVVVFFVNLVADVFQAILIECLRSVS